MKKAELAMLRDPAQERRLVLLNQLPDVVRTLKTYPLLLIFLLMVFVIEKIPTMVHY